MNSYTTRQFRRLFASLPRHVQAVGVLDGDIIAWFWIGSHAGYDRLLENL